MDDLADGSADGSDNVDSADGSVYIVFESVALLTKLTAVLTPG